MVDALSSQGRVEGLGWLDGFGALGGWDAGNGIFLLEGATWHVSARCEVSACRSFSVSITRFV